MRLLSLPLEDEEEDEAGRLGESCEERTARGCGERGATFCSIAGGERKGGGERIGGGERGARFSSTPDFCSSWLLLLLPVASLLLLRLLLLRLLLRLLRLLWLLESESESLEDEELGLEPAATVLRLLL